MPLTLKTTELQYKDSHNVYHGINAVAEKPTADVIADLDAAIEERQDTVDGILDAQETRGAQITSAAQSAVDGIEGQKNTMIASIASVAGMGTDTTLTQSGVAADAKVTGDKISEIKSALTSVQDFAYDLGNVEYSGLLHTGKYCRYSEYNGVPAGGLLTVSTASNGVYTDLIPLGDAKEVSVHTAGSTGTAVIAFYDGSQAYISGIVGEGQTTEKTYKTTTIPVNAKYVRFSGYSSSVSVSTVTKCYVGSGDDALLESAIRRKTAIQANTDLNNLKDNGFYLLYSGYTYTNAPSFFTSGQAWLFVYDMINNGSHFRVQLLMKASNGKWAARLCSTVGGVETWYSWTEYVTDTTLTTSGKAADAKTTGDALKLALSAKTAIQANTDLNDLKEIGIYLLYSGYTYTNAPAFFTSGSAWLINITDTTGAFVIQMIYKPNGNKWAMRLYNTSGGTGTWYSWNIFDDEYSALAGKKMSIIGDSISTYQGYIPEGYSYYYPSGDVNSVSKTWWKQVADKSGMTVLANASWSGSGVCDDDDDDPVNSAKVAYSDARISDLSTVSDDPDIIVVLIGTNDFKHSNELGTLTDGDVPPDGTTSLHTFKEAYSCMINKIHAAYPDAHIYCCTLIPRYDSSTGSTYPIKNSSGIPIHQYNKAIMDMAEWMNCGLIRLDNIFSLQKVYDYTVDHALHPNAAGAKIVGNRILSALIEGEKKYIS